MSDGDQGGDDPFRVLARAAREAVFVHEDGVIREINEAFTRLLGWTREEIVGKHGLREMIDPESAAAVAASMKKAGPGGTHEVVMWTKDRRRLVVESASEPILYQGRRMRLVTVQDLTDRRRAESSARRAERLLDGVLDATDQGIFVKDEKGRYLLRNRAWKEAFGGADRDSEAFPPRLLEVLRAQDERIRESREPETVEREFPTVDGSRTYLTTKFPLVDDAGRVFAIGGISTDVTARKRAADLFATLARATVGEVGAGFFDGLSRALAGALAADYVIVGELILGGTQVRTLSCWVGEEHAPAFTYDLAGTPCEQVLVGRPCIYPSGAQELFPTDALLVDMGVSAYAGVPIRGADGNPRGIIAVLFRSPLAARHDLEESLGVSLELFAARAAAEMDRVAALSELLRAQEALERSVRERTAELTAANAELESFAYSVSHDLRAPLRHIAGFSEMLAQSLEEGEVEDVNQQLGVIRGAARRMSDLIDDLLNFSRMSRSPLAVAAVDLAATVKSVVAELAPSGVEWEIGALPVVVGDAALLRVVLANLLDNAVKYSRRSTPPRIAVRAEARPTEWSVTVEDNGVGFDMKYAQQLFGVFRRLHRDDEFEGTGIGLATVQRIVRRHGGSVTGEGVVGEGARFTFTLPRPEAARGPDRAPAVR